MKIWNEILKWHIFNKWACYENRLTIELMWNANIYLAVWSLWVLSYFDQKILRCFFSIWSYTDRQKVKKERKYLPDVRKNVSMVIWSHTILILKFNFVAIFLFQICSNRNFYPCLVIVLWFFLACYSKY